MKLSPRLLLLVCCGLLITFRVIGQSPVPRVDAAAAEAPKASALGLVQAGLDQIGKTLIYDAAYVTLTYPNGDVPIERGVCCDVVIRALRAGGVDLQKLIHEDMAKNFSAYPKLWGLSKTDKNIDHRRVPNMAKFFTRQGKSLPVTKEAKDYKPGDFVVCSLPNELIHIMLVSTKLTDAGVPYIIHNIGAGAREEDRLFEFKIEGHFRWYPEATKTAEKPKP